MIPLYFLLQLLCDTCNTPQLRGWSWMTVLWGPWGLRGLRTLGIIHLEIIFLCKSIEENIIIICERTLIKDSQVLDLWRVKDNQSALSKKPFIEYFQLAIIFISGHDHNFGIMMKLVRKKHSFSDCGKAARAARAGRAVGGGRSGDMRRGWNVKMVWIRGRSQITMQDYVLCVASTNIHAKKNS